MRREDSILGIKMFFQGLPWLPMTKTLCFHCRGVGWILAQGTKISHVSGCSKKKKKKKKDIFLNKVEKEQ